MRLERCCCPQLSTPLLAKDNKLLVSLWLQMGTAVGKAEGPQAVGASPAPWEIGDLSQARGGERCHAEGLWE